MNLIINRIRQQLPDFSNRQQQIANYILTHSEDAAFLTATQLANQSGTSEATVIRFANRLGFEKYADFQEELRMVVRGKLTQIERLALTNISQQSSTMQILTHAMRTDQNSIEKTLLGLHESEIETIVDLLFKAEQIFVTASHGEYGLACYFGYTLSWIRENVYILDGSHSMAYDQMYSVSERDVLFAYSFPPYPIHTIQMAQIAKDNGARVIALTDNTLSPLALIADHCLCAHNEQLCFADNVAPAISLLSALLNLISRKDPDQSTARLEQLTRFWHSSGLYGD